MCVLDVDLWIRSVRSVITGGYQVLRKWRILDDRVQKPVIPPLVLAQSQVRRRIHLSFACEPGARHRSGVSARTAVIRRRRRHRIFLSGDLTRRQLDGAGRWFQRLRLRPAGV